MRSFYVQHRHERKNVNLIEQDNIGSRSTEYMARHVARVPVFTHIHKTVRSRAYQRQLRQDCDPPNSIREATYACLASITAPVQTPETMLSFFPARLRGNLCPPTQTFGFTVFLKADLRDEFYQDPQIGLDSHDKYCH